MAHDFKNFPELTNSQMELFYFESPHKQIVEDFRALCVRVIDGDTISLRVDWRDFDFPVRFVNIQAKELNEGGRESKEWLKSKIENEEVDILMSKMRVEKWGRLLGNIIFRGMDMGEESINLGHSVSWEQRNDGKIPSFEKEMEKIWR